MSWALSLVFDEPRHRTPLKISQYWFDTFKQQAIICSPVNVDPDLCGHMASLGHNNLGHYGLVMPYGDIDL